MIDVQINRLNSLIKSDDLLDDRAADIAIIAQIVPLALALKNKIQDILSAGGQGQKDLRGVAEDKKNKRLALEAQMLVVSRGAAALFQSTNRLKELRIVDFTSSELINQRDAILYATAKELHALALANEPDLINVAAGSVALLNTAKEAFFDVIQDPKREEEDSKVQNASITPMLNEGAEIRKQIDVYMQTFIATNPTLYNQWAATLAIDDTGANNPPIYTLASVAPAGAMQSIDYGEVALQNSTEIKLINRGAAPLDFGFGKDPDSFSTEPTIVNADAQQRKSAVGLGYNAAEFLSLNIRNQAEQPIEYILEFYDMG